MSAQSDFLDAPPAGARLTDYDRAHLTIYLRLLDAESEGAPWEEVTKILFGIDPTTDPARAEAVYLNHLARAHWMTNNGFRDLIRSSFH
ncbi:DNA -binding domain-containing protein [Mesorhizobium loti]|uniref:DUF2285 domain-containing protein n=1 Tax=Rhizobium loti TaxID=381 RepID=A0A6M7U765_RHILI|nr:DUF2285 domain-containing protein [Mesorhizobium loti]OBQ62250.1 DUF2285 domain-containing protein [Mesorhizobium loti]QKC71317.1 DUF2285 domain-containing protein [Mesorhizobium loti]